MKARSGQARRALLAAAALAGCQPSAVEQRARAEREMKTTIGEQVREWRSASQDLANAAPRPVGRGWDAAQDAAAIAAMRDAWARGRVAYERIEGAVASIFPESDLATDARYDDYLAALGPAGDRDAFDDQGVVGMHGIERILWADRVPARVVEFERGLPGYRPAAFPATEAQARAFRERLAARLVRDIDALAADFDPLELDIAFAFQGLVDLAAEQVEKVDLAATGREESRYAQATMRDLRANYRGCVDAYRVFQPWLIAQNGESVDRDVLQAFQRLEAAYARVSGDAIPEPPAEWSSVATKPEHLTTDFGRLFGAVRRETDPASSGSLHHSLLRAGEVLGLPAPGGGTKQPAP